MNQENKFNIHSGLDYPTKFYSKLEKSYFDIVGSSSLLLPIKCLCLHFLNKPESPVHYLHA